MNLQEAEKVAIIIQDVDGGCPVCVGAALTLAKEYFPEFIWDLEKEYGRVLVKEKNNGSPP